MTMQYIVDEAGKRVSVIMRIDEYQALLDRATQHDETAYLLSSPANAERLREAMNDAKGNRYCEPHSLIDND